MINFDGIARITHTARYIIYAMIYKCECITGGARTPRILNGPIKRQQPRAAAWTWEYKVKRCVMHLMSRTIRARVESSSHRGGHTHTHTRLKGAKNEYIRGFTTRRHHSRFIDTGSSLPLKAHCGSAAASFSETKGGRKMLSLSVALAVYIHSYGDSVYNMRWLFPQNATTKFFFSFLFLFIWAKDPYCDLYSRPVMLGLKVGLKLL